MSELRLGVIGTAHKENERRAALHPEHIGEIPEDLRARMIFEQGYGERFGMSDDTLRGLVGSVVPREQVFEADIVLLPKPTEGDFASFREGQVIWGWPHCVQGPAITQVGIDKRLTFIAWEEMHHWDGDSFHLHAFHVNNELAGYCSVLHSLQLAGICGQYGPHRRVAVIGFGSVGRGAVHALRSQGFSDLTLFTQRPGYAVKAPIPGLRHWQYRRTEADPSRVEVVLTDSIMPMPQALGHFDIIVNAILQDTDAPQMFLKTDELTELREHTVIVDVSCDEGMGFEFAKPTSFEDPWFPVGIKNIRYYAVDHSPSYLWNTATHSISKAIRPFLRTVMDGPSAWAESATVQRAIEIQNGVILNQKILRFQGREKAYPHKKIS